MKKINSLVLSAFFISIAAFGQSTAKNPQKGHTDNNKFRQLKDVLPTPNSQRTASGAPGHKYYQQKFELKKKKLSR